MVRINLVNPKLLTDQHLIAEYVEILMLAGHARKHRSIENIPKSYKLGEGHIKFFKNKLLYLAKRHEFIKKEMKKRGFATNKILDLREFNKKLLKNWKPSNEDLKIIKERLIWKIKQKPEWYRYYRKRKNLKFYKDLLR